MKCRQLSRKSDAAHVSPDWHNNVILLWPMMTSNPTTYILCPVELFEDWPDAVWWSQQLVNTNEPLLDVGGVYI